MRKIIRYFVTYPKAVNILILFFIVFGTAGIISLNSSFFPLIDSKFISINANYPGASPEEIEEGVILKIEENLKGIPGVVRVTSTSNYSGKSGNARGQFLGPNGSGTEGKTSGKAPGWPQGRFR